MAEKQDKYIVIKIADMKAMHGPGHWNDIAQLQHILEGLARWRKLQGKSENRYIVCNQDEPYAEKVWQTILQGAYAKAAAFAGEMGEVEG
jgi:hypothetical protein